MLYEWILENRELLKLVYAIVICLVCSNIVLKTDRLFKLSGYQGLRYLRNAFFFYALAFMSKFIFGKLENPIPNYGQVYFQTINIFFQFFIIMAGFFLLYSLIWKRIEKEKNYHSLFNVRIGMFSFLAIMIIILNSIIGNNIALYSSQIILFLIMSGISLSNYLKNGSKYYFFVILMGLISWSLNTIAYFFSQSFVMIQIFAHTLNMIFFLLFLYSTTKMTKK